MDPKKWLYNAHKYTSPSPEALKWMVPLVSFPAAYYGHKLASKALGNTMEKIPYMGHAGRELKKSNPLMFAATVTALNTALSQGLYRPEHGDQREMKDWKSFYYPDTLPPLQKKAAFDPMLMSAASLEQGWGADDAALKHKIKKHRWMVPSVNARNLKENIWDTPGFTPGQKTFLRDSVDGAMQIADNPELLSQNDLGMGAQRAIVNNTNQVPGLLPTALKASIRAAEGAFIGRGLGTLLGGTPETVSFMQNTGLAAGVLSTSDVMKKIKSYF